MKRNLPLLLKGLKIVNKKNVHKYFFSQYGNNI